jgi:hypothetical protein
VIVTFAIVISLLVQFGVAWMVRDKINEGFADFGSLYIGGTIVHSRASDQLYNVDLQKSIEQTVKVPEARLKFLPYNHAPFEAIFFALLARLSYPAAFWVFWVFNVLVAYCVLFLIRPEIPFVDKSLDMALLGMGVFKPLIVAEGQGQDSVITLLLFTLCFLSLLRGRPWVAGAMLGLAMYKPQFSLVMMLILFLASERRWRIAGGFILSCLFAAGLSIAAVGWRATIEFPRFVSAFASQFDDAKDNAGEMPNIRGLMLAVFSNHMPHHALVLLIQTLSALLLIVTAWALYGRGGMERGLPLKFSLAAVATLLTAYHGWIHDMTLLLIPLLLVWNFLAGSGLQSWSRRLLGGCMLIFACGGLLSILTGPVFVSLSLVFFALLLLEVRKIEPEAVAVT